MENKKSSKKMVSVGPNSFFMRALTDADYALLCATRFCSPDMEKFHKSICDALMLVRQAAADYILSFDKKSYEKAD